MAKTATALVDPRLAKAYHVQVLEGLGCIELVRTAQRRGATEHYYRALTRPLFSDDDWARLPPSVRQGISDICSIDVRTAI